MMPRGIQREAHVVPLRSEKFELPIYSLLSDLLTTTTL